MDDNDTMHRRARLRELIRECFEDNQANLIRHIQARGFAQNQGELSSLRKDHCGKSFGDVKAANLAEKIGLGRYWFAAPLGAYLHRDEWEAPSGVALLSSPPPAAIAARTPVIRFDANVSASLHTQRPIPVISAVQAGRLKEISDPYPPGAGRDIVYVDAGLSECAFALEIEGDSMLPEFRPGDRVIIDPAMAPNPGDFVVAKNGNDEATFKKYRPRGRGPDGREVFELVPLNEDYPTLRSDVERLHVIGVMVEHRKRYRVR